MGRQGDNEKGIQSNAESSYSPLPWLIPHHHDLSNNSVLFGIECGKAAVFHISETISKLKPCLSLGRFALRIVQL